MWKPNEWGRSGQKTPTKQRLRALLGQRENNNPHLPRYTAMAGQGQGRVSGNRRTGLRSCAGLIEAASVGNQCAVFLYNPAEGP